MQDGAHPAFFRGSDLAVEQEEDVDVRLQAELPSAVAAERDDEAGVAFGAATNRPASRSSTQSEKRCKRRAAALAAPAAADNCARAVSTPESVTCPKDVSWLRANRVWLNIWDDPNI
jgi:hypothetical protein